MSKFKQLQWNTHEELNGVYAEPLDLKWRYSIIEHAKGKVEFALLDSYYEYAPDFPKFCRSIPEAQDLAHAHYSYLLSQHMAS